MTSVANPTEPAFDLEFTPAHGVAVPVAPMVERVTVNNPGPFTFHGTNSYIVGDRSVAVIDPGNTPDAALADMHRRGVRGLRINLYSPLAAGKRMEDSFAASGL